MDLLDFVYIFAISEVRNQYTSPAKAKGNTASFGKPESVAVHVFYALTIW
jgi:hypothetical protein